MELDCSAVAAGSYNLTDPICPSLKRTESSGSINSISASNSASGDAIGPHDIVAENGLMIVDPYQKKKKDGGDNYSASGSSKKSNWTKNYCSDNDLFPFETLDKEGKAALANEGKKSKKLWSVYGSSSPTTSSDKTGGGSSGNSKRSTSKSLDSDSSMFKNLVLVSLPSKKGGNSNATATTKGFSKSMVSLSRGSECDNHHYPAPPSPSDIHNYPLFSSAGSFTSRTRSPSVSVLDEANHSASHEYPQYTQNQSISNRSAIGDISSLRSPQLDANSPAFLKRSLRKLPLIQQGQKLQPKQPLPQKASTAPISLITNDWNTTIRGQRSLSQPLRCVDPELQQPRVQNSYISSPTKSTENVSRHIVAPDELAMAMAIDREAEGKRQQQGLECVEKSEKSNWKPTVDGTSEEKSHSVTILTVTPESEVSPTPTLTTIVEAASTLADDTTPRAGEETSASGSREQTQTAVTTTAAWSLPPPKRLNNPDGQETVTTQHTTRKITTRSSLPTHATSAAQAAEKRNSKGTDLECSKQPSSPAVKENDQGDEAHAIPLSAIKGTETQPAVAVNIGESLQGSTRESHASPTSSVSPPILPRRSPFRSAPIPPVNPANYTAS
ncbi:hypothetical protein BGX27_009165 [Mortierella sp. AM989]|nr:hypothetical protein BGX27_009165 [Mortierella sp. AM989]